MERVRPWVQRTALGWTVIAVLVVLGAWWMRAGRAGQPGGQNAERPVAERVVDAPQPLLVHVAGAVKRPGVYRIAGDGRIIQAIRLAGGPTKDANLAGVNLAAPVVDGQQILVPATVQGNGQTVATGSGPVSLSSATVEQLDGLDGIGPTLAARIVAWRQAHGGFTSVDQLTDVPGIGETRLEALRSQLTP